jgi:hypothetical protein
MVARAVRRPRGNADVVRQELKAKRDMTVSPRTVEARLSVRSNRIVRSLRRRSRLVLSGVELGHQAPRGQAVSVADHAPQREGIGKRAMPIPPAGRPCAG